MGNYADRAVVNSATRLEEAWAWGFDVDTWRAHLNALTWPEVCTPSRDARLSHVSPTLTLPFFTCTDAHMSFQVDGFVEGGLM